MAEGKQRSGLFKFFYIVLSVITFPIFAVLFILRHPLWVLFLLCLGAGGAVYYPMSQGVKPEEVLQWYQDKYKKLKYDVVTQAVESGKTDFVPKAIVDEVVKAKQKMEEEKIEAARPKSENYNENISRDKKVEEIKQDLKQRRRGFKKKGDDADKVRNQNVDDVQNIAPAADVQKSLNVDIGTTGGLADILGRVSDSSSVEVTQENTQESEIEGKVEAKVAPKEVVTSSQAEVLANEKDNIQETTIPQLPVVEKDEKSQEPQSTSSKTSGEDIFSDKAFEDLELF